MKNLRIGWSDWIETLNPNASSASGARNWCMRAWKRLQELGHTVVFLQKIAGDGEYNPLNFVDARYAGGQGIPLPDDLDAIFMAHRWQVPGHEERWGPWLRQQEILEKYASKIPILMHDEDLTVDTQFEKEWGENVIIAEPSIVPIENIVHRYRLYFPMLGYDTTFMYRPPQQKPYRLIYVGNNYNRLDVAHKYYNTPASAGLATLFVGNWMVDSPERPSSKKVLAALPDVHFLDRVPPEQLEKTNMQAAFTVHIAPEAYMKRGFITGRWAEAVQYGLVSFVPSEFQLAYAFWDSDFIVNSGTEVFKRIKSILKEEEAHHGLMRHYVSKQIAKIDKLGIFHVDAWLMELGKALGVSLF